MYHNNKIYTTLAPKCKLKLSSIIETDMAQQIPTELTTYLEKHIIVCYNGFDRAHDISHVRQVIEESLRLARHYDVNPAMVLTIAALSRHGTVSGTRGAPLGIGRNIADRHNTAAMVHGRTNKSDERGGRGPPSLVRSCPTQYLRTDSGRGRPMH